MFHIIVRARNCSAYIRNCLISICNQTEDDFRCWIVLDAPKDDTANIVGKMILVWEDDRFKMTVNPERMGLGYNIWYGVKFAEKECHIEDDDVLAWVDGDDALREDALYFVKRKYDKHPETLVTYGSYIAISKNRKTRVSQKYSGKIAVRKEKWHGSHLKTMKYKVFKAIPEDEFKHEGKWAEAASDRALMYAAVELAGYDRAKHIRQPIYYWNDHTGDNTRKDLQKKWDKIFRARKPLPKL